MKRKVLKALKPKVKSFGFNEKELMGVAAKIADNLQVEENASDEDVNAAIEIAIDAVIPYLSIGQSQASRVIDAWKKNQNKQEEEEDEDVEEEEEPKKNKPSKPTQKKTDVDNQSEAVKSLLEAVSALTNEVKSLKSEKVSETRKSRLEKMLKDTGIFGATAVKNFARMKFDSDEQFEEYLQEVEEDLKAHNQERANEGLSKLGTPPTIGGGKKNEVVSDAEIDAIADSF